MVKNRNLLPGLFSLGILLAVGWYYAQPDRSFVLPVATQVTPDAVVAQLRVRQYDKTGQLQYRLYAPKMQHFAKSRFTEFTNPVVAVSQAPKAAWIMRAARAEATEGNRVIKLIDNVVIHQPSSSHNVASMIRTQFLAYHTETQIAETDQEISLEQPGLTINSLGLRADFAKETVSLLARARGRYDKNQRTKL